MKKPAKNRAVKKKKIVQTFPNFLSKEDWDTSFFEYLQRPKWGYGHASARKTPSVHSAPLYWEMILDDDDFFVEHVFNKIKEVTGDDLILKKVYAGGNTFGTSGVMPVQTYGNQCGVVRQSFIQKIEIQSIKSLYQIKVFTLNQTSLTWENQQQSSLKV